MKNCPRCGLSNPDNAQFCGSCGEPLATVQSVNQYGVPQNPYQGTQQGAGNPVYQYMAGTDDHTAEFDWQDIQQNKIFAVFAYIGILILIPILGAPQSRYARFHANQGLILLLFSIALGVLTVLASALLFIAPVLSIILQIPLSLVGIAELVFAILGIVNAATGKAKELPLIGRWHLIKY